MKPGSTVDQILEAPRTWAKRQGIDLRGQDRRHTVSIPDNLFDRRLSPEARAEFEAGAGHELGDSRYPEAPPGLSALLSSAALVYNVFDYWRHRDKRLLAEECG